MYGNRPIEVDPKGRKQIELDRMNQKGLKWTEVDPKGPKWIECRTFGVQRNSLMPLIPDQNFCINPNFYITVPCVNLEWKERGGLNFSKYKKFRNNPYLLQYY